MQALSDTQRSGRVVDGSSATPSARFRGTCTEQDCHKQQYSQQLCQRHYRQAGLVKPARPAPKKRVRTVPISGSYPKCSVGDCPRRSRRRGPGGRCRKHGGSDHANAAQRCINNQCGNLRAEGSELCERHGQVRTAKPRRHVQHPCSVGDCVTARFRAGLCKRHLNGLEHEVNRCAYPTCKSWSHGTLCGYHAEIGVDFAAGDWFDWVAVDQMFHGSHDLSRQPSALEVLALAGKAARADLRYSELAERLRISGEKFERWRYHAERAAATFEVAA